MQGCGAPEVMYFLKCIFLKCFLSKVHFCEMYPTCVSSKLCEFIFLQIRNFFHFLCVLVINDDTSSHESQVLKMSGAMWLLGGLDGMCKVVEVKLALVTTADLLLS